MKWTLLASTILILCVAAILYQRTSLARKGKEDFTRLGCSGCHLSGAGPNLKHVVRKHDDAFLAKFIQDPSAVYVERKGQTLNPGYMPMPNLGVGADDAHAIIAYLNEINRQ